MGRPSRPQESCDLHDSGAPAAYRSHHKATVQRTDAPDALAAERPSLSSLDAQTFFGPIKFDATGKNLTKPMVVIQIQAGKVVTVWPKDMAEADLVWPGTTS